MSAGDGRRRHALHRAGSGDGAGGRLLDAAAGSAMARRRVISHQRGWEARSRAISQPAVAAAGAHRLCSAQRPRRLGPRTVVLMICVLASGNTGATLRAADVGLSPALAIDYLNRHHLSKSPPGLSAGRRRGRRPGLGGGPRAESALPAPDSDGRALMIGWTIVTLNRSSMCHTLPIYIYTSKCPECLCAAAERESGANSLSHRASRIRRRPGPVRRARPGSDSSARLRLQLQPKRPATLRLSSDAQRLYM